ncbi:hypothetical protein FV139_13170 [Parahaliea maris]|uniref:HdeD family acid-resistance protein n=1 Tax=Parahaliea maris TaxID=2716870 RepID=A0A5C8ZZT6_9GAMM|nr:DUF308 domain-containing protein [Parahaliea maris]TXS92907.1 hypothetical protein FV139_13170 [Parahaliea maris]
MVNDDREEQLEAAAEKLQAGVAGRLGDVWWYLLLRGSLAVLLGIFAIFWPEQNVRLLLLAVGIYCLADGAITLVVAARYSKLQEQLGEALVVLAIGVVLVLWPDATLRTLLMMIGAAIFFVGLGQVLTARKLAADDPAKEAGKRVGLVTAIVGLILAVWPGTGVAVISWVIGIAALLIGGLLIFLGSRFKRLQCRVVDVGENRL